MDDLLKLLLQNARFTDHQLATMLGITEEEVRAEIEKYCSSKSYNLVGIFKDEGISGAKANEDEMSIERGGQTW